MSKKILIVEDETPLRTAISSILTSAEFEVIEAANGQEGLDLALKEHPDLILLDQFMPVMDGVTMLQMLREDDTWGKSVKVIFLTNINDMEKVAQAAENNVTDFLIKSDWNIGDVVMKIKQQLGLK